MRRISFVVFLLCVAGATGPRADTKIGSESSPARLPDSIVVTANRSETPLREIASSITVVTADQIARSQDAMVADVLRKVPGLDVVQNGGTGQLTSVFLRGANAHHTLIIVDGIKMNDPSTPNGSFDISNLSVDNIERIEILRGPQSVLYGSDAIGGVIQVFTRRGGRRPQVTASSEAGAFKTYEGHVVLSGQAENLDYSAALSRRDTKGISATGGRKKGFEADGYTNTTFSASLGFRASESVELRLTGRITDSDADLDKAFGIFDDPDYALSSKEKSAGLRLLYGAAGRLFKQQAGIYLTDYERSTDDIKDDDHPFDAEDTYYEGSRLKVDWQSTLTFSPGNEVMLGAEIETEKFSQDLHFSYWDFWSNSQAQSTLVIPEVDARTMGIFVHERLNIGRHWFSTVGFRLDDHEQFGSIGTYRLTTAYLFDNPGIKIKSSIGTGFKAPSLYQLYDSTYGNPYLQPERTRGWELGLETWLFSEKLQTGASWYSSFYKELIVGTVNVARAKCRGIEAFAELEVGSASARLDYTYTRSRDAFDSVLVRRPQHKASLSLHHRPTERLSWNLVIRYIGARVDLDFGEWPAQRVSLADYGVMDISAAYDLSRRLQLFGRINNLFDADYTEVFTYGTAPRAGYLGLKALF